MTKITNYCKNKQIFSFFFDRMFKRLLDPKMEKRCPSVLEVNRFLDDRWLAKLGTEKAANGTIFIFFSIFFFFFSFQWFDFFLYFYI